jgi:protein-tyrosine kinase
VGKIFKALEKSQQSVGNSKNIEEKFEAEPLPLFRDQENVHKTEIETRSVTIDPMLVTGLNPQSMESEQFRLLKNNILFPEKGTVPKCIMITSTTPGDGKSFVAANFAITLSQSIDEYVLLMDCDLRAPSIHSMFGYNDNTQGLSEYLSKAKPLSSLLVNSFLDKLTILPAGQIPPNPSELLSSEQMRRLIHEVKLRYSDRYIIIVSKHRMNGRRPQVAIHEQNILIYTLGQGDGEICSYKRFTFTRGHAGYHDTFWHGSFSRKKNTVF